MKTGVPGKPGSFKTPIRRRVKLRHIRDALRGRASLIPLRCPSSSPPQPLRRVAAGDPCWLRRKEDAPFDGVEEKAGAAAFQTLFETPCSALLRGLWPGSRCWPCPLYPLLTPTELRVPPGCSAVLFSLPHPDIRGSVPAHIANPPQPPDCGSKTEAGSVPEFPQCSQLPYSVEWSTPSTATSPKPP